MATSRPFKIAPRAGRGPAAPAVCMIAYTTYETDARVIRQAETAASNGFRVDVITPRRRAERATASINGVRLYRLAVRAYKGTHPAGYLISYTAFLALSFFRLTLLHFRHRYQVIHVNNMPDFLVFATFAAKATGAKIILDIHDPMPETYRAKFPGARRGAFYGLLLAQEKASAAFSNKVLTVNEPVKTDILVKDGIPEGKIAVIANFPDENLFTVVDLPTVIDRVRAIYFGSISERFGLLDVLDAIARVRNRERIRLRIIGEGDLSGALRKKILDLGLETIVRFDNRSYPLTQLPSIIAGHHLGLAPYKPNPATRYMLPVKLLELMAMGIPAITVVNAPIRYYFDKSAYFAYDNSKIESLTELIERILEQPSMLMEKRRVILQNRERFLWRNEGKKYMNVIRSLIEGGPG